MSHAQQPEASLRATLPTNADIDALVYELRQTGTDSTYEVVRAAISRWAAPAAQAVEPVASVFTMEALVPGGREVSHVTLHKPLPAGTKLYAAPAAVAPPARIVLDGEWSARLLDGRPLVRDEMGFGDHPDLPLLDEGMKPRAFFEALGIELKHTLAEDDLSLEAHEAMNDASNWSDWTPRAPAGEGWKLVAIFDTEDGQAAWWMRDAFTIRAASAAQG